MALGIRKLIQAKLIEKFALHAPKGAEPRWPDHRRLLELGAASEWGGHLRAAHAKYRERCAQAGDAAQNED